MKKPLQYFPIYCNVARVPLLVKVPNMAKGKRIRAVVQPWDMTATILDAFGIPRPPDFIGNSLLPLITGRKKKIRDFAVCGTNSLAQAMDDRWMYTAWRGQLRSPSLIDLRSDPLARRNVVAKQSAVVKRLHREIVQFMKRQGMPDDFVAQY